MQVQFYGYTVQAESLRKGQMILAQAKREKESGDIDKWFYAGCPVGRAKHAGGRPRGVTMPCGWGCGKTLTAREMREHFTTCPKRPKG